MNASEKLRLLGENLPRRSPEKLGAGLLLIDALPQIVAVVEALREQLTVMPGCICYTDLSSDQGNAMWRKHESALAALDEALT